MKMKIFKKYIHFECKWASDGKWTLTKPDSTTTMIIAFVHVTPPENDCTVFQLYLGPVCFSVGWLRSTKKD